MLQRQSVLIVLDELTPASMESLRLCTLMIPWVAPKKLGSWGVIETFLQRFECCGHILCHVIFTRDSALLLGITAISSAIVLFSRLITVALLATVAASRCIAMHNASQILLGEHDFSAFRAAQCQAAHPVRQIFGVSVNRVGDFVILDIEANAFLYHMVRNLVGSLQMVGSGQRPPEWIEQLLEGKDRTLGGDTASASGLYLQSITYPEHFGLPVNSASNSLLLGGS
ncbi:tRNA pseudouridine synthase A [marine gamma proteobacterium HTCC2080]|nr:tRNA pseudouridine synthase A [marine gamma proteobacterium HTCC2080]